MIIYFILKVNKLKRKRLLSYIIANVARIIYSTPQARGVYIPENFAKFFPKVYPLTPVIIFVKMGFQKLFN